MIIGLIRKAGQLLTDPVLRNWTFGRVVGRWPGAPAFNAHRPPYLTDLLPLTAETPMAEFSELQDSPPSDAIELCLAGEALRLVPGDEATLFGRIFDDIEVTLALHRFAWLPLLGDDADPAWVNAILRAWMKDHAEPADGWAWHPYTAAERVINILTFAGRSGLPGPVAQSLDLLALHGPAIAERLEYFGDHHTSNHLANNGRGLFLLGLALGLPKCAEIGGMILTEEAKRIFTPSGILREGSSHYHALLAASYGQCAEAARKFDRREAAALTAVAERARAVTGCLKLPGGFPLIGDISPDLRPEAILKSLNISEERDARALAEDGWYRLDVGPWSGIWHAAPDGFSHMPGHGHQDCGGFELHYMDQPVFIDPGRGGYGETGDAALYRSASVHNTLLIDNADPYPPNKPYYSEAFRRHMGGPPPRVEQDEESIRVAHDGFARLGGPGTLTRTWRLSPTTMTLSDSIEGRNRHRISRILVTPLDVFPGEDFLELRGRNQAFRLTTDGTVSTAPLTRWTAYGQGVPVTAIRIASDAALPWRGKLSLETC